MVYVPENARWEEALLLMAERTTGRATLAEVEPMREATLGANMRAAAIVYEGVRECGDDWKEGKSLEKSNEGRVDWESKECWT